MRILIAGLGSVGRRHLRNLIALGATDCLLLRSGRATLPDDEVRGFDTVTDVEAALRWAPDAAIIATPTSRHLESAIPLARAGCHLLIEKPISHTREGLTDLAHAAGESGARVMVAFQYRHHPGLQAVRKWVAAGAVGRVVSARAHYGDYLPAWHPWEDHRQSYAARADLGGGAILTLCHPFDYLAWLFGPVVAVTGAISANGGLDIEVEDTAEGVLECAGGVLAGVHVDFVQRPPSHTLLVIGTGGTITWDQADGAARLFRASTGGWEVAAPPAGFERNDMFLAEMRCFLDVIRGVRAPEPTLADGVHVLEIALALRDAARAGHRITL